MAAAHKIMSGLTKIDILASMNRSRMMRERETKGAVSRIVLPIFR